MGHFGTHQVVKLPRLQHMFDRASHFNIFGVFLLLPNLVQHIVKNIADHLDLRALLQLVVLLAEAL